MCSVLSCIGLRDGSYSGIMLDPDTLLVSLQGFIQEPYGREKFPEGVSYELKTLFSGDHVATHWERRFSPPHFVSYNVFRLDANYRLIQRTKSQELLRGPYGVVFMETLFRYDHPESLFKGKGWKNVGTSVSIRCLPTDYPGLEPPLTHDYFETTVDGELVAVSIIRVVAFNPSMVIASALYAPDGRLHSLHTAREQAEHLYGSFVTPFGDYITEMSMPLDKRNKRFQRLVELFAFPTFFPVKAFAEKPTLFLDKSMYPDIVIAVTYHFGTNHVARQYLFEKGRKTPKVSTLRWKKTQEDTLLEAHDRNFPLVHFR